MAGRALPCIVIAGSIIAVATLAIRGIGSFVIESSRTPGVSRVAGGALPSIVIAGSIIAMAILAVGGIGSLVIEVGRFPG